MRYTHKQISNYETSSCGGRCKSDRRVHKPVDRKCSFSFCFVNDFTGAPCVYCYLAFLMVIYCIIYPDWGQGHPIEPGELKTWGPIDLCYQAENAAFTFLLNRKKQTHFNRKRASLKQMRGGSLLHNYQSVKRQLEVKLWNLEMLYIVIGVSLSPFYSHVSAHTLQLKGDVDVHKLLHVSWIKCYASARS